jgi:dTDP-glucose 4,6-dehydratase
LRVLITGGAGFIGSHAVDHFVSSNDDVWVMDKLTYAGDIERIKKHASVYKGKFLCEDIVCAREVDRWVNKVHPDVIVNFAAETHVDNSITNVSPFIKTNFEGACNLMTAARKHHALYVHLSTDEVYGVPTEDATRGFVVSDSLNPRNPYAASKAAADMMLLANLNTHNQEFLAFRPSNNFGPNQHEEKFLPKLIRCLISKSDHDKINFPLYGDGKQVREWTYAPDTAKIIRHAIINKWRGFHNVSSNISFQNIQIIEMVKNVLLSDNKLGNSDAVMFVKDRPGHDRRYWIESKIDQTMFTPFDKALRGTVEHYFQKFA